MGGSLSPEQNRILSDIRQYMEDAQSISLTPSRFDKDQRNFYALSMVLFALANRLIDLGRETAYSRGYAGPEEELKNKVIFKRLSDYGIIDPALRQDLIRLVDFRNRCSHHFHEVSKEDIRYTLDSFPRYEIFIHTMAEELAHKGELTKKQKILITGIILGILIILLVLFFA